MNTIPIPTQQQRKQTDVNQHGRLTENEHGQLGLCWWVKVWTYLPHTLKVQLRHSMQPVSELADEVQLHREASRGRMGRRNTDSKTNGKMGILYALATSWKKASACSPSTSTNK